MTTPFEESQPNSEEESLDQPRETGHVKWFDDQKGYGFIKREDESDIFVHFTSINREPQTLREHERVEFTPVSTEKGPEARKVTVLAGTTE